MTKTIAYVLYPGLTALDLVGPLTVTAVLDGDFETVVVARDLETLDTDAPIRLGATATFDEVTAPYAVVVPGGTAGTFAACADERLLDWLRTASATAEVTASVCTGSLILGAAGLLEGRRATTHWGFRDVLPKFGAIPVAERWVQDGGIVTAAGVSAGIDMALHLVREFAGEEVARFAQLLIEYDPLPPLGGIDWDEVDIPSFKPYMQEAMRAGLADHPELLARLTG
ncbi:DJ-1/PfpI family protein [Marinactinospora rubrisoli]|uniref:DJ-1/PfpI family protein n=1 Tax=Marinactinospora rubrisoli TaxID=2715399 RepID=A0ABW2KEX3_9ACTN